MKLKCYDELTRLESMKHEKMAEFILNARNKIIELWNLLHSSEEQRRKFTPFFSSLFIIIIFYLLS